MKVVIIGGDKVTYYLVRTLQETSHDIIVIENRLEACEMLNANLDVKVFHGDGTNLEILKLAGCAGADMMIALTGKDENNLIACELAKLSLGIKVTVSKINNPKNTDIFTLKGVDRTFSSTQLLVEMLEEEVQYSGMHTAFSVPGNPMQIVEFVLSNKSDACGKTLQEYKFPRGSKVVLITHKDGKVELPVGDLVMLPGDLMLLICKEKDKEAVWKKMVQPDVHE